MFMPKFYFYNEFLLPVNNYKIPNIYLYKNTRRKLETAIRENNKTSIIYDLVMLVENTKESNTE